MYHGGLKVLGGINQNDKRRDLTADGVWKMSSACEGHTMHKKNDGRWRKTCQPTDVMARSSLISYVVKQALPHQMSLEFRGEFAIHFVSTSFYAMLISLMCLEWDSFR